jgi:hypothetical protein
LAESVKVVVQLGFSSFEPLAETTPIPLSIVTLSAPSTSQLSVVVVPGVMSAGVATNLAIARPSG